MVVPLEILTKDEHTIAMTTKCEFSLQLKHAIRAVKNPAAVVRSNIRDFGIGLPCLCRRALKLCSYSKSKAAVRRPVARSTRVTMLAPAKISRASTAFQT